MREIGVRCMVYEKKQIFKEDGRILIFYHFPRSANPEQQSAFKKIEETEVKFDSTKAGKIV